MTNAMRPLKQRIVNEKLRGYSKISRVVFGVPQTAETLEVATTLTSAGYTVVYVNTAEQARLSAVGHTDTAVIVPVATEDEGGLLTTAKIVTALPTAKVILFTLIEDERVAQFAEFIDAKIAFASDGPAALLAAVQD